MGTETGGTPRAPESKASVVRPASADAAIALVRASGRSVVTFLGFSGSGYEDPRAVERAIAEVLDGLDPKSVTISAGATPGGIGAVYPLAKKRGFTTVGIVSAVAEREGVDFSPDCDEVLVIPDDRWGGRDSSGRLSPTSAVIVGSADEMIAIGGGEIARDEAMAAKALGTKIRYIAADMNHAAAIRRARQAHLAEPDDFRGALHPDFGAK
jgi:hypothetical protein